MNDPINDSEEEDVTDEDKARNAEEGKHFTHIGYGFDGFEFAVITSGLLKDALRLDKERFERELHDMNQEERIRRY